MPTDMALSHLCYDVLDVEQVNVLTSSVTRWDIQSMHSDNDLMSGSDALCHKGCQAPVIGGVSGGDMTADFDA